jgi:hypothetical protein
LNYLHKAGTTPELHIRKHTFPLDYHQALGEDGSKVGPSWGHANPELLGKTDFDQVMFWGRSSAHSRVLHFVTGASAVVEYMRTGQGSMYPDIFGSDSRVGSKRVQSVLPAHVVAGSGGGDSDQGDLALTHHPFWALATHDADDCGWAIAGGDGSIWQLDGDTEDASADTHHQVYVRRDPCSDGEKTFAESDVDCGGACAGCEDAQACVTNGDCLSGTCDEGSCSAALASSCSELLALHPTLESGVYRIDVDDDGSIAPLLATCDMDFSGGGWTLVLSTARGGTPLTASAGEVMLGSNAYLPGVTLSELAAASDQVHVRTHDDESTRSISSLPGSSPITNLAALKMLEHGDSGPASYADWSGPFADESHLAFDCTTTAEDYPSIYQACGYDGLHLWTGEEGHSRWTWNGNDEPMEVWVR